MWYLFRGTSCIGLCSDAPNTEILKGQGVVAIFSEKNIQVDKAVLVEDEIQEKIPTLAEKRTQALIDLDAQYDSYFTALSKSLGLAMLDNDADLINELRADYVELKRVYDANKGEIENG
ncbi:hypothetical protein [Pelosinus sp. IPA-1]|uniref:hypothetical protein n=1 Tax=Pelosinus sp. IPA-1 TaxID=3029569 RepID=UPI0024362460|nr:hypothetical protein [Pelosinus sp. IPA-1]GMB00246.1 hypothetical protein PIPA1_30450 [Pelosinus sp. IPA-1]